MKTLNEVSEMAGVSKTAVRKRLKDLELMAQTEKDEKGVVLVPEEVAETVVSSFGNRAKTTEKLSLKQEELEETDQKETENTDKTDENENDLILSVVDALKGQLEAKDAQIAALQNTNQQQQETIQALTAALAAAQALHAGTIKQLSAPVEQDQETQKRGFWDFLKR